MIFHTLPLLEKGEVTRLVEALGRGTFVDGKLTAHGAARDVKENLQLQRAAIPEPTPLDAIVLDGLRRNTAFQTLAFPKRVLLPLFNRYEPGMAYGPHLDAPIMGGSPPMRADLSITVFLSRPESYDGGELVIASPFGEEAVKLDAGEAAIYHATALHWVTPVMRGVRLAAVTWAQSAIRDDAAREALFDLSVATDALQAAGVDAAALARLRKGYNSLVRLAADL